MIAHRYLFALSVLLLIPNGQAFAQSNAESRVGKLEETVRILERRVATLEDQLHQRNAAAATQSDKAKWRRLQQGLSEADVERLLGSPTRVDANSVFTVWYYDDPDGGEVHFNSESRKVDGWEEP
ncbi:hypothetical protein ACNFH5_29275 [Pseudomonas sp. NY15435]|uniref:hypothetical protein n=1 Tax=Pseudomonas sp. NY15435 TaxID=3400358 RepID=UPI003A84512F